MNRNLHVICAFLAVWVLSAALYAQTTTFSGPELLGKPTDNSITINIVPDQNIELFYEYGTTSGGPYSQTSTYSASANVPHEVVISGLSTNTRYYYQMHYRLSGGSWNIRDEHTFHTQRVPGSTFTFTIISDTHAEFNDYDYQQAIENIQDDRPDFHLDLGDTFMTDYDGSQSQVNDAYLVARNPAYMGGIGHSAPIFLASGNHENEEGWNIDEKGAFSPAVASIQARKWYYPTPVPDDFYSGNNDPLTEIDAGTYGDQYREDYYAWTWGDALFIVFDPFQYTMYNPYGNTAGEGWVGENDPVIGDRWNWSLGEIQYNWLRDLLEEHKEKKYKFMFAHQMLGGTQNYVREGATPAHMFEWGGYNANGSTWGWDIERPGWEGDPIHHMMVEYGVSAFFHGHDHQYAYQVRDGIVYQCLPKPSTGLDFNYYSESNQYTERVIGNAGHLRVTVTPTEATVQYVRSNTSGISHTYTIQADGVIAVELSSCSAHRVENGTVAVEWKTASEVKTAGFFIQRSDDPDNGFCRIHNQMIRARGNSADGAAYQFVDRYPGNACYYRLEEVTLDGSSSYYEPIAVSLASSVEEKSLTPSIFALSQNFPNPFNPVTRIDYTVPQSAQVCLNIYDVKGRLVKQLVRQQQEKGHYNLIWDGRDDKGQLVVSGTYLYHLQVGERTAARKMVLLK